MSDAKDGKKKIDYGNAWEEARALIWKSRGRLALGLSLMLVNRLLGLVLPASTKYLVDDVIGKSQPDLLWTLALVVGLGTGSTAAHFVRALGEKVRGGLKIRAIPTSEVTAELARAEKIPLVGLEDIDRIDVTVDGADEADRELTLIKGGGGALLREKMVATFSRRLVIIADGAKLVETLGRFPLPVEVVRFAWKATARRIADVAAEFGCEGNLVRIRGGEAHPYVTDNGNYILDMDCGRIPDAHSLGHMLSHIVGVVETGLFIGMADALILGRPNGVDVVTP